MTGGYYDVRRSRLDTIRSVKNWSDKYESGNERLQEVTAGTAKLDQEIVVLQGEQQKLEAKRRQTAEARQPLIRKVDWIHKEEAELVERVRQLQDASVDAGQDARDLEAKIKAYETELKSKMTQALSTSEQRELTELAAKVEEDKTSAADKTKQRNKVRGE